MKRVYSSALKTACAVSLIVASTTALAKPASVFMLQFGSFESTNEANDRVAKLKSRHGGLIGNLPSRVQQVALPDNLTVYRTQAGPVASRAEAQSICAQLASNGDECYVVETAMTTGNPTTVAASQPKAADVSFMKPKTPTPAVETVEQAGIQPAPAPATVPAPLPSVAAKPEAPKLALPSAAPARSSEMSAVKALESAPPISKTTTTRDVAHASAPKVNAPKKETSFWDSINPFSDDDEDKVQVAKPKPVETAVAKVEAPRELPPVAKPAMPELVTPKPVATPVTAPVVTQHASAERPVVNLPAVPVESMASQGSSLPLPPPPAPNDTARRLLEENRRATAGIMPEATGTVPQAQPVRVAQTAASPFERASNETLARAGKPVAAISAGDGTVKVGEAQRVPVTNTTTTQPSQPLFMPSGSSVAPADASIPIRQGAREITPPAGELASPQVVLPASQTMGKTLWAELTPYKDASAALSFWDKFRSKNPDFPVVRVRVVQSYAQKTRGAEEVSLRVGPFAKRESIAYLCGQYKEVYSLKCYEVTDMGTSNAQGDARTRAQQGEANLAAQSMASQNSPAMQGTFWLQLGSYPTLAMAQNTWGDLKQRYPQAMAGMNPNIAVPPLSSGARPTYRLRGGPFTSELAATKACLNLKSAGGNCLVSGNTQ